MAETGPVWAQPLPSRRTSSPSSNTPSPSTSTVSATSLTATLTPSSHLGNGGESVTPVRSPAIPIPATSGSKSGPFGPTPLSHDGARVSASPDHLASKQDAFYLSSTPLSTPPVSSSAFTSLSPIGSSVIHPSHRQSPDSRRIRSEVQPRRHMSITLGTRPSIVTGGYETSSEEEEETGTPPGHTDGKARPYASRALRSASLTAGHTPGVTAASGSAKRHRASAVTHSSGATTVANHGPTTVASPLSPSTLQGLGIMNSPHLNVTSTGGRRRALSLISPPVDFPTTPSRRASSRLRPTHSSASHTPRNTSLVGPLGSSSVDHPAGTRAPSDFGPGPHSRSTSMRSIRSYEQEYPGLSSQSREGSVRETAAAVRKQKLRDPSQRKRGTFGASLGLAATPREATLSADQIQALLQDVDVSSAMHRINAGATTATTRRLSTQTREPNLLRPDSGSVPTPTPSPAPYSSAPVLPDHSAPSTITRPFLVSAPPALTSGDWPGRVRSDSVASSNSSPQSITGRNIAPMTGASRLRTTSLSTVSDTDRAPMSFKARPVSPILQADETEEPPPEDADNLVVYPNMPSTTQTDAHTVTANGNNGKPAISPRPSPIPSPTPQDSQRSHNDGATTKRRISGLFGTMRKKHDTLSTPQLSAVPLTKTIPAPATSRPVVAPPPERAREQEMRLAEQERREEELAQERLYRAVVQVRSHPASQRRAQRAAVHLDGYYAAVNDGLENPPKFNPLAVLRWTKLVEEQKVARSKYEAEREVTSRASLSLTALSGRDSINSPQSEGLRVSLDARRGASSSPMGSRSFTSITEPVVAPGWHYTLSDVAAYTACRGHVDIFIPPIIKPAPKRPPSVPVSPGPGERSRAPSLGHILPYASDVHPRPRNNSVAGSELGLRDDPPHVQGAQHGTAPSTGDVALVEDNSLQSLSRTPSFDISRSLNSLRGHRAHHSTTAIPGQKGSSLQVFKTPFERLARRNISAATSSQPTTALDGGECLIDGADEDDPSRRPGWLNSTVPHASPSSGDLRQAVTVTPHTLRDRMRRGFGNVASTTTRGTEYPHTTGTSDEEHHRLRNRLFRRGRRGEPITSDSTSRVEAIRQLETIVGHERQLRYEVTASRQPTQRELKAQEDLTILETQVYDERATLLINAQQRVDDIKADETQMSTIVDQLLSALDRAQATFNTAADVDVIFPNLDTLRHRRKAPPAIAADDESADSVAPLRGEDSDRGGFSAGGGSWSDGRTGRGTARVTQQRKQSLVPSLPMAGFVYGSYPRRSIVDPTLGEAMDPIRRAHLSCDRAREAIEEMTSERHDTTIRLQGMVETINQLIAQKDRVRRWTTRMLDQIAQLRDERDTLRLKIRGGIRPRMARVADSGIDLAARWVLGIASVGLHLYRLVTGRGGESWLPWALFGGTIAAVLGYFYMVGEGPDQLPPITAAQSTTTG